MASPVTVGRFARHLALAACVTSAALCLVVGAVTFVPLILALEPGAELQPEVQRAADRLLFLHQHFWPLAIASIVAVGIANLVLARRLVGPLERFRRVFDSVAEGVLPAPPIRIRGRDYLHDHAASLDAMLATLRARATAARERCDELVEGIDRASRERDGGAPVDTQALLARLADAAGKLRDEIRFFRSES
jgi:methyl-accepting chemotaxis protein